MDYLSRDAAPFTADMWQSIDNAVVDAVKACITGRRFIPVHGPLGPGARTAVIDTVDKKQERFEEGFAVMDARATVQVPQLYEDFWLYWRDIEAAGPDLSAARAAAETIARREDAMIFYGVKALGIDGILTAKGTNTQKRSDWAAGEGAFADVAAAVATLQKKGRYNRHTLVVSPDLFVQLQRIQPGTGVLESERIKPLVGGRIFMSAVLEPKTAFLVSAESRYIDLLIGQDIATAYTELVDLNHHLRILETALPRIKAPDAIVVMK